MESNLDKMFKKLVKEGKTFAEAKEARTKKLSRRLLYDKLVNERRDLILGSLQRHHRAAQITTQICSYCAGEQDIVEFIHVWSHSPHNGIDTSEITTFIKGRQMYEIHDDLPLVIQRVRETIPICAACLAKDYDTQVH